MGPKIFCLKAMSRRILINIKKKNQSQARIAFYWIIADVGVAKKSNLLNR